MNNTIMKITDARVAAVVKYTPAYTKQGGKEVQAKATIPVMISNPPYTDRETGEKVDGKTTVMFLTAWGAMADTCAKYLPVGKEFSCEVNVNSFESKILDPGTKQTVLNAAGQALITVKHGFTIIPGTFRFGNDSADQILKEISTGKRSLAWDGKIPTEMVEAALASGQINDLIARAKQGPAAWQAMRNAVKALKYVPGMAEYGVAQVVQPTDAAIPVYGNLAQQIAQATGPLMVDGFTYEQYKASGWTDEQLLTAENGKYACLVPKKAPAPPAMSAPAAPSVPSLPVAPPTSEEAEMEAGVEV